MKSTIFNYKRSLGAVLLEKFENGEWIWEYTDSDKQRRLNLYSIPILQKEKRKNVWFGHEPQSLIDNGRDLLGEALIAEGDPDIESVMDCLPEIAEGAYMFLAGPASHSGLIVDKKGWVYPQLSGREREPLPLFIPEKADETLGSLKPLQCLVGGRLPLLCNVFSDTVNVLELLYFVEPGDTSRTPTLWIRVKKYTQNNPLEFSIDYRFSSCSREAVEEEMNFKQISSELFLAAMADAAAYWIKNEEKGTIMNLPNETLSKVATGAMLAFQETFTAERPHYGHKFYGRELHDNFPPNLIWSIEACCLLGRETMAKRIFDNMLFYILNDEGSFSYRQGNSMFIGAAAAEYGQILFLANKYKEKLGLLLEGEETKEKLKKLACIGKIILKHFVKCPEFDDLELIKMCAEADTNSRINVYLSNNLWAIRGLGALSGLMETENKNEAKMYEYFAELLQKNINIMIEKYTVRDTRFGDLPPFRFGYTATPYTLSNCLDTFEPISEVDMKKYFVATRVREVDTAKQDITENTYANYRYYLESMSAMLLKREYTDAIVRMRENLGGEMLGMTRLRIQIDDWPVIHYAKYLLETERIEKYLLLMYAHTFHHGNPELMCYYEQVTIKGEVHAPDCVPSLLTTPMMLGWMFAYESMIDGHLMLLSALPKDWYNKPFEVKKIGYTGGRLDIFSDGRKVYVDFSSPSPVGTELIYRTKENISLDDIQQGAEFVKEIRGNKLILHEGIKHAEFAIV